MALYRRVLDALPPMEHELPANFGNQVRLLGYTIETETPRPGDTLHVIFYWESQGPTEASYTVFAHLLDPEGRQVSQEDSMPMSNLHPTTVWRAGEVVVDGVYELPIPLDAPPGSYALEFGLYNVIGGQRLDVLDHLGNPQDTRVVIQDIYVEHLHSTKPKPSAGLNELTNRKPILNAKTPGRQGAKDRAQTRFSYPTLPYPCSFVSLRRCVETRSFNTLTIDFIKGVL